MATTESSSIAKAGLTTGIIGTSLAGLLALNNGNGGLLGGLFGNNNACHAAGMAYCDQLQAQIAELKAEKYANNVGIEVFKSAREQDAKIGVRFDEIAREIADMRVREAQTQGQIALVASNATNGINVLQSSLTCLQNTVAQITKTIVPKSAVCPEPMPLYNSWTAPTAATTSA